MEESNTVLKALSASEDGEAKPAMSLVCYDVSTDSDNEMECTDVVKIKLEPLDNSPNFQDQEIEPNDNSFEERTNETIANTLSDNQNNTLSDNNALSNVMASTFKEITQNCIHEINGDAQTEVNVENPADKSIYRQSEEINLSSDTEDDSSESSSSDSDESAADETDDKSEKVEVKKPQPVVKPVKKKGKDPFADEMKFPPIEDLQISIEEDQAESIGTVYQIVDNQVIVQSFPNISTIDIDSVLFLENGKRALGKVFDVFGSIHEPLYVVIFNSAEQVKEKGIETGQSVCFAPASNEHTSYVIVDDLKKAKGSDASWKDNREPPPNYCEYSDDEEERRAKQAYKHSKKVQKGLEVVCCYADDENTKKLKRENYNKMRLPPKHDQSNKSRTNWRNFSQNQSYKCENIYSRGPPQFGSQPSAANHNRFRSSAELCDQSNNFNQPRFGGPPQFPIPPPSYSPFLGPPPPSPVLRSTPSPNVCPPYLCSSPGPPQLWQGSMSPLPSGPPPAISPNHSSFYRNANQDPTTLYQVPPPHFAPLRESSSVLGQNPSRFASQPNISNVHSQVPTSTISSIVHYPPPVHNQLTSATVMSHNGHSSPIFCPQRPPPVTTSHRMPHQVLPPHLPVIHQLVNPSLNFLPQGPPPAIPRVGPPPSLLLQSPARPPSPYLLLQKSPPPQLQQINEPCHPFMQFQLRPPQHMSVQGCAVRSMPPNIHPPASDIPSQMLPPTINYQVPPPPTNMSFKTGPPPQKSSSQGPPACFLTGPPLTNFSAAFNSTNRLE